MKTAPKVWSVAKFYQLNTNRYCYVRKHWAWNAKLVDTKDHTQILEEMKNSRFVWK